MTARLSLKKDRASRGRNEEQLSAVEQKRSLRTIEEIFEARRQIQEGKRITLDRLDESATRNLRA